MALPPGVNEVDRIAAPGGGFYVLGSDGGVFTEGAAPFYGSMWNFKPGQDTLAGKHEFGKGALSLNPTGGYSVTDSGGRKYDFDTNAAKGFGLNVPQQGNTLNADPAMLAFLRTSGLSLETAANQVRTQTAALQAAKDVAMGDINNQYGEQARSTQGNREARGVLRSSGTQQALDQVERARMNAVTGKQNETATAIGGLNSGLVNKVLEQQQKAAELGLSTGQNQDWDATLAGIKKKYAPELAAGGLSG
jgi:hypothetical protein